MMFIDCPEEKKIYVANSAALQTRVKLLAANVVAALYTDSRNAAICIYLYVYILLN